MYCLVSILLPFCHLRWRCRSLTKFLLCSLSNNVDVIVFSVHEEGSNQCVDEPQGTYVTPVPNFMEGYLQQYLQTQQDKGYDDYTHPDSADYVYCTRVVKNGEEYWLQIGCADGTSQDLAVNIYSDNTCSKRSTVNGMDDANVDLSDIQVRRFMLFIILFCFLQGSRMSSFCSATI